MYLSELKDKDTIISKLAHSFDVQKSETEKLQRAVCLYQISVESEKSPQFAALKKDFENSWFLIQKFLNTERDLNANENYLEKLNEFYHYMSSKLYVSSSDDFSETAQLVWPKFYFQ